MDKVLLIRYGEIYLKGRNRGFFEKCLLDNIKRIIGDIPCSISRAQCRYLIEDFNADLLDTIINRLKMVIGIHSISVAYKTITDMVKIAEICQNIAPQSGTFRITVNRADKRLEQNSQQIARFLGSEVLSAKPNLKVDLFNAEKEIFVDIRECNVTYIYFDRIMCLAGMPVGSSGKGLALLSGGIDSPVACFRMAKRGMNILAIHFHSFPYTSLMAREKTLDLARKLSKYCGSIKMFIVPFTEIQQAIHKQCPAEFMITIMRRIMMRISERFAILNDCGSLITGESLAQVASQTQESIL
ncbi:MAG: tRNA sulfurtransferase, partial [Clostridia bacterium]|nr:tRNA sulfurtransferase [Clostridia bacterium]